jgi:hypothetical protein
LPHPEGAIIDRAKLENYLLSPHHPLGRFKARFFASLGFTAENWGQLERAFREQHLPEEAEPAEAGKHGQAFIVRAILRGPTGASAPVVSVWFVRTGEGVARFITAYPGGSK